MTRADRLRGLVAAGVACMISACGAWGPQVPQLPIEGRVVDAEGGPVAGAVVSDGRASTLTDDAGRFRLVAYDSEVTAVKPGFRRAAQYAEDGRPATFRLDPEAGRQRVGLDRRWGGGQLQGLRGHLEDAGHEVVSYPDAGLSGLDVLVVVTPGALGTSEITRLRRWVREGGRLILCGEWGGYPAQDLAGLNALAEDAGLAFTGATVKLSGATERAEWLRVPGLAIGSLDRELGREGLYLFTCTSLALSEGAKPLFATESRAYSVMSRLGSQVLAGVGPSGFGKVFAIGDSSFWLDEDSEAVGLPNWQRGDNRRLATALMRW